MPIRMSLTEYVVARMLGNPRADSGELRYWYCPLCESSKPTLIVKSPNRRGKCYWKCLRCHAWGDEYDAIKWKHPLFDFPERREYVTRLQKEYERMNYIPKPPRRNVQLEEAYGKMWLAAQQIAKEYADVSASDLLAYVARYEQNRQRHLREHECDSPYCYHPECRRRRGLKPLREMTNKRFDEFIWGVASEAFENLAKTAG